ncbi:MAG: NB-ARC domain-containing protein, partial [Ktedonobacteraceae bacterium]
MKKITHTLPTPSHENSHQLWMVPYARNACFIGREMELQEIAATLDAGQYGTGGQAISGAGGSGKTQLALEYVHLHREKYRAVFWVLAETREALNAAYSDIAILLDLPEKKEQEHHLIVEAVKGWLASRHDWLLILDHAMDLGLMKDFLPAPVTGHLLLTTRASTTGKLARRIKLKTLDEENGVRLLLCRSGTVTDGNEPVETAPGDYEAAKAIVSELDRLPLALDLAGAYIAATSCGLPAYLELLRRQQTRRAKEGEDQPGPVARALRLSCEKLAKVSSATLELLQLCAFFAPDEIPERLLVASVSALTKPLQKLLASPHKLDTALTTLQNYALVTRDPEIRTLVVQREVQ